MTGLLIGDLARRVAIPVSTIRFYERKGLIDSPQRRESGYRVYPDSAVERLKFIRHAQGIGFTLQQIQRLLWLQTIPDTRTTDIRKEAENSVGDIRAKIIALREMESSLQRLLSCCTEDRPATECPIIFELHST